MATGTPSSTAALLDSVVGDWRLGLASGVVGGLVAGGILSVLEPRLLSVTMPALYGLAPPADALLGSVVVLVHASVLGVAFAGLMAHGDFGGRPATEQVGTGIAFGLGSWLALAVVLVPLWLGVLGSSETVSFPFLSVPMLAGHLGFGVTVGVLYFAFDPEAEDPEESTTEA
jgi:hypothetical protein